jgi:hypothetical protein
VTLVAVDTACHELTAMAIRECTDKAEFGEVLVLTDEAPGSQRKLSAPGAHYHQIAPCQDAEQATRYYWYAVPPLLATDHFMVVHWDSWIVNANKWKRDFLEYDYIGAPWWYAEDDKNVGNGGFSIRSSRLANYMAGSSLPFAHPEDDALCRRYRPRLEVAGFTWAPTSIAGKFSFERVLFYNPREIFGFHGMFNWPLVLDADQIEERVAKAPPYVTDHIHYKQMRETQAKLKGLVA